MENRVVSLWHLKQLSFYLNLSDYLCILCERMIEQLTVTVRVVFWRRTVTRRTQLFECKRALFGSWKLCGSHEERIKLHETVEQKYSDVAML